MPSDTQNIPLYPTSLTLLEYVGFAWKLLGACECYPSPKDRRIGLLALTRTFAYSGYRHFRRRNISLLQGE